jgi:hypothetical protein
MMDDTFDSRLEELSRAVLEYEALAKKYLGFFKTITYKDILFNVSADLVIADLSPLAFFNLVEHIDAGEAEAAAIRLYERIMPLLFCRHCWVESTKPPDQLLQGFSQVLVCDRCTACTNRIPGQGLPVVGRS